MTSPTAALSSILLAAVTTLPAQAPISHVAAAKREYAAIFSHPDTPCTAPQYSTVDYEACMNQELAFLQPHMDAFLAAIRLVQADTSSPSSGNQANGVTLFDKTNASWKIYRDNLCHLAYAGYEGGTGAAPAEQQCDYEQDRVYIKSIAHWTQLKILAD